MRRGDVLLRSRGWPPVVATGPKADNDGIAKVVEVDPARLDAQFVTAFLKSDVAALPVAHTLGAINRDDLHRWPHPPAAADRAAEVRRRVPNLAQLDATVRALAAVSAKIIDEAINGLTTGVLSPDLARQPIEGETSEQ